MAVVPNKDDSIVQATMSRFRSHDLPPTRPSSSRSWHLCLRWSTGQVGGWISSRISGWSHTSRTRGSPIGECRSQPTAWFSGL